MDDWMTRGATVGVRERFQVDVMKVRRIRRLAADNGGLPKRIRALNAFPTIVLCFLMRSTTPYHAAG